MQIINPWKLLRLIPSRGNYRKPNVKSTLKRQEAVKELAKPISEAETEARRQKWLADHERGH